MAHDPPVNNLTANKWTKRYYSCVQRTSVLQSPIGIINGTRTRHVATSSVAVVLLLLEFLLLLFRYMFFELKSRTLKLLPKITGPSPH